MAWQSPLLAHWVFPTPTRAIEMLALKIPAQFQYTNPRFCEAVSQRAQSLEVIRKVPSGKEAALTKHSTAVFYVQEKKKG